MATSPADKTVPLEVMDVAVLVGTAVFTEVAVLVGLELEPDEEEGFDWLPQAVTKTAMAKTNKKTNADGFNDEKDIKRL
jgi:hypothetical protein